MNLLEYLKEIDNELFIETEKIKKEVEPILNNRIHLHYTDHSINHSIRILEQLNQIMSELMSSSEKLNKYEIYILISSIYLHDIGMQFDRLDLLEEYDLNRESKVISDLDLKLEFIRNHHHIISKIWIIESIKGNSNFRKVYFGNPELGEIIASIAESHNTNLSKNINNYSDYIFNGTRLRLNLLACLISLGDVLDADARRIDIERLKHINIEKNSRLHWWKHYYISGIYFENGLLKIQYIFPKLSKDQQDIYFSYFSSEVKYWLAYNKDNFKNILSRNYIRFEFDDIVKESLIKEKLIDEDYNYIENYVLSSRISKVEKIRQALAKKLGYKNIEVSEEKESYIILYKNEFTKIIAILKSEYEVNNFEDIIIKIIKEIKED
ncbi:hypothetical protein [Clostridium beijerinckii]|uniref:HD domain-containing protein n=1 Tax=Clostridium beijerinckii TaxID=1520 RepID=UPI0022E7AF13|nr:hypothetical protein [Clostridium beijerinckii]